MKKQIITVTALSVAVVILLTSAAVIQLVGAENRRQAEEALQTEAPTQAKPSSYMIPGVEKKVILQMELDAGCETDACTMLMNILGFDLDEITFADNYLDCHPVFQDPATGYMEGPDMYSAFAGTARAGWGVYAPSMAKSMNKYLADEKSNLKAYDYENIPLDTLCDDYILNNVPVMVWATTAMLEPTVRDTWKVNYVDENAKTKIGDDFSWYEHEHCLVLVGYSETEYYFCDSGPGEVSHFEKALCQKRYEQLGSQCIVVK